MLVSGGPDRSYFRVAHTGKLVKNGTEIDIHYNDDGVQRWISFNAREMLAFLESEETKGETLVTFDEPSNVATAVREFKERRSVNGGI